MLDPLTDRLPRQRRITDTPIPGAGRPRRHVPGRSLQSRRESRRRCTGLPAYLDPARLLERGRSRAPGVRPGPFRRHFQMMPAGATPLIVRPDEELQAAANLLTVNTNLDGGPEMGKASLVT